MKSRQNGLQLRVLPPPVVFGDERNQDLLLHLHREGPIDVHRTDTFRALASAGFAVRFRAEDGWKLALDPHHPAKVARSNVSMSSTLRSAVDRLSLYDEEPRRTGLFAMGRVRW